VFAPNSEEWILMPQRNYKAAVSEVHNGKGPAGRGMKELRKVARLVLRERSGYFLRGRVECCEEALSETTCSRLCGRKSGGSRNQYSKVISGK